MLTIEFKLIHAFWLIPGDELLVIYEIDGRRDYEILKRRVLTNYDG